MKRGGRAVGLGDGAIDVDQTAPAEKLLAGDTALDRLDMREDLVVARRARSDVHVAALAGHRNPAMTGMDETGDAEAGAGAEHDAAGGRFRLAGADLFHVLFAERHDGERLGLEIVENDHIAQAERLDHHARPHHPGAIGEFDLVAVDRTGDGEHRRTRLDRGAVEDGGLDRIVDRGKIGGLHDRELFGLRIGIDQDGEAGIGAADIADQDRELQDAFVAVLVCHGRFRPLVGSVQPFFLSTMISAVARLSAIGMS